MDPAGFKPLGSKSNVIEPAVSLILSFEPKWLILCGSLVSAAGALLLVWTKNERQRRRVAGLIFLGAIMSVVGAFWASQKQAQFEREMRIKAQETLAMLTGGDSFVYVHFEVGPGGRPRALLRNDGRFPVREIKLDIVNQTQNIELLRAGKSYEERRQESMTILDIGTVRPNPGRYLTNFPFPDNDGSRANYLIYIDALNGNMRELVSITNVKGDWLAAYRLFKVIERVEETRMERATELKNLRYADSGFPRDESGRIDWLDKESEWGLTNFVIVDDPSP